MTPRLYLELGLFALAAAAGWGYVHQRDDRLRAEGRLEIMQQRADSTARAAKADKAASVARDSAAARRIRQEAAARADAERRATKATARIPAKADSVVAAAAPADSAAVRAELAGLQAVYEERDRARLDRIASDSVVIGELRAVDVTRLAAIASLEAALAASQAEADTALEARPGFVERALPKVAIPVAFIAGWVLHSMLGG